MVEAITGDVTVVNRNVPIAKAAEAMALRMILLSLVAVFVLPPSMHPSCQSGFSNVLFSVF
jgi:hypothetical protein